MPNVSELISAATKTLEDIGSVEARLEAEVLLAASFHQSRSWVIAHLRDHVPEGVIRSLKSKLSRRGRREPLPYILGKREFYGLEFKVTPAVLIPRQETEMLVDVIRDWAKERRARVLDIGAGSGCVGIATAATSPAISVVAIERDRAAAKIAVTNGRKHRTAIRGRWRLVLGDWLSAIRSGSVDAVVGNLPYVRVTDACLLTPEVYHWEPEFALFAGNDGMDAFRTVIPEAFRVLKPGGLLALEFGIGQGAAVEQLMEKCGFVDIAGYVDPWGKPRVIVGTR